MHQYYTQPLTDRSTQTASYKNGTLCNTAYQSILIQTISVQLVLLSHNTIVAFFLQLTPTTRNATQCNGSGVLGKGGVGNCFYLAVMGGGARALGLIGFANEAFQLASSCPGATPLSRLRLDDSHHPRWAVKIAILPSTSGLRRRTMSERVEFSVSDTKNKSWSENDMHEPHRFCPPSQDNKSPKILQELQQHPC